MKKQIPGLLLALLLTLTGCSVVYELQGVEIQGTDSASASAIMYYGTSSELADLPVQEPEDGNQIAPNESQNLPEGNSSQDKTGEGNAVDEDGWYSSKDEVALYIHLYGELPDNYVSKKEAEEAGWRGGNVERYTGEGTAIGGSTFGNREGLLPEEKGRIYIECDIDTVGENSRGPSASSSPTTGWSTTPATTTRALSCCTGSRRTPPERRKETLLSL